MTDEYHPCLVIFLQYPVFSTCLSLNSEPSFQELQRWSVNCLTAMIQDKVILSITIFFRSTCNKNIIITKKVLQTSNLKKKIQEIRNIRVPEKSAKLNALSSFTHITVVEPVHYIGCAFSRNGHTFSCPLTSAQQNEGLLLTPVK